MKRAFFLTGEPGCGKTTIIKEVVSKTTKSVGGFYTEEIRTEGARQGFNIVTLDGTKVVLAHVNVRSPYRVSKYRVDIESLNKVAVSALKEAILSKDVVVIDEVGKMELFSSPFKDAVLQALESGKKVLGTIMLASHPWADKIKQRQDVETITVTRFNRNGLVKRVLDWLET